jgi:hypothetical protein
MTIIDGIMDSKKYRRILDSCFIESSDIMNSPNLFFNKIMNQSVQNKELKTIINEEWYAIDPELLEFNFRNALTYF